MPTVFHLKLDAEQYKKELQDVISRTKASVAEIAKNGVSVSSFSGNQNKTAVPSSSSSACREISSIAEDFSKNASAVSAAISPLHSYEEGLRKIGTAAGSAGRQIEKINSKKELERAGSAAASAAGKISQAGGATSALAGMLGTLSPRIDVIGQALSALVAGPVGVLTLAAGTAASAVLSMLEKWKNSLKDLTSAHEKNASEIRRVSAANEEFRSKSEILLRSLHEMSSKERLSNSEKEKAISLIRQLKSSYGDLGIEIDNVTGKISGTTKAMSLKLQADKDRRIRELQNELKELDASDQIQSQIIKSPFSTKSDIASAGEKIQGNQSRRDEVGKLLLSLSSSDHLSDFLNSRQVEIDNSSDDIASRRKALEERRKEDSFGDDFQAKIKYKKQLLDGQKAELEKNSPLWYAEQKNLSMLASAANAKDQAAYIDAEENLLQIAAKKLALTEKIYSLEKEISDLSKESENQISQKRKESISLEIGNLKKELSIYSEPKIWEIESNALTQRGGFSSGAVDKGRDSLPQILEWQKKTASLLSDIKRLTEEANRT